MVQLNHYFISILSVNLYNLQAYTPWKQVYYTYHLPFILQVNHRV